VAVSACLLGKNCRYDAKNKLDEELVEQLRGCEVIPFCPEEAILGTPRETIDLVEGRAVGNESGTDYTQALKKEAHIFCLQHPHLDEIYFKSKSPSCGLHSARVYDRQGNLLADNATGVFASELKKWYKNAKTKERK
jgi:uncharacterized protein YbbK (DUF523 family)